MIDRITLLTAAATGGAGVATGTVKSDRVITGKIHAVHLRYLDSPPATAEATLEDGGTVASEQQILASITGNTDMWFYPRVLTRTNGNDDITYNGTDPVYDKYVVSDHLVLTLAAANNGDQVEATVFFER